MRYGIWSLENGYFESVKLENYMLINQVYCILDYFIIKAKKLKGNFNSPLNQKIKKILSVETFSWKTLVNEILDLFTDLAIVCDEELNHDKVCLT